MSPSYWVVKLIPVGIVGRILAINTIRELSIVRMLIKWTIKRELISIAAVAFDGILDFSPCVVWVGVPVVVYVRPVNPCSRIGGLLLLRRWGGGIRLRW